MLFIMHNAVLNDGEIKSDTGEVQDCELNSSYEILVGLLPTQHSHHLEKKNIFQDEQSFSQVLCRS